MNTRHHRRISRRAAGHLLDHAVRLDREAPEPDQLARVLAAAAAPGRQDELAGEQMAVAAFEAGHLVPIASSRRKMTKSLLAKLLTTKILAVTVAAAATGGVAYAASTGTFSASGAASGGASVGSPSAPASGGGQATASASALAPASVSPSASVSALPSASASASASALAASVPQDAVQLCQTLAATVASAQSSASVSTDTGLAEALASPALAQTLDSAEFSSWSRALNPASRYPTTARCCSTCRSSPSQVT